MRYIVEVFDIDFHAGKRFESSLDGSEVIFDSMFAFSFSGGSVLSDHTCDCVHAPG